MTRKRLILFYALCVCVVSLAMGATWLQLTHPPVPPLAQIKTLPDFQLTERSGNSVGLADLKGKVWLADFVYSTCPGPCRMISSRLAELQTSALKNPAVRFVSVTTDPDHDTPEVLQKYADHYSAPASRWLFLTGEKAKVYALIRDGFLLAVAEQPGAEQPIVHSTKLMLVDKKGVVRNFYDGASEGQSAEEKSAENNLILRDINRLLRE